MDKETQERIERNRREALKRLAAGQTTLSKNATLCIEPEKVDCELWSRSEIRLQVRKGVSNRLQSTMRCKSRVVGADSVIVSVKDYAVAMQTPGFVFSPVPEKVLKLVESFSEPSITEFKAELSVNLLPFQREGVEFLISRGGRGIIADDMGLGKTVQAIAVAMYYRLEWPLLVISPASLISNWKEQLRVLANVEAVIVRKESDIVGQNAYVLSYELAVKFVSRLERFQVVIVDESHALKNTNSKRTRILVPFLRKRSRMIMLTGTPAVSRPVELYPQLQAASPELFPNFFEYARRYCNATKVAGFWIYTGCGHSKELQTIMELFVMIRRTKDEVLSQLPEKIRRQVFLSDKNVPLGGSAAEYMDSWRRTGEEKFDEMLLYIEHLLEEPSNKLLVFMHHVDLMNQFASSLKCEFVRIDGTIPPLQRQKLCDRFQADEEVRVGLLSLTAASTGLTLTRANTVVFVELFWNPGLLLQAEDRAHRIGQKRCVDIHYLLARGTTDDVLWPLLVKKMKVLESVGLMKNAFNDVRREETEYAELFREGEFLTGLSHFLNDEDES